MKKIALITTLCGFLVNVLPASGMFVSAAKRFQNVNRVTKFGLNAKRQYSASEKRVVKPEAEKTKLEKEIEQSKQKPKRNNDSDYYFGKGIKIYAILRLIFGKP